MNKFYLTIISTFCFIFSIFGTNGPEKIYLVGTMNDWTVPAYGEEGTKYFLTDDGNGEYTGTFSFDSGEMEFKIFTEITDWSNEEAIYSAGGLKGVYLYSQAPTLENVRNNYNENIVIPNWQGGQLTIKAKFNELSDDEISLFIYGDNQPEWKGCQKNLYAVGDFNDWKLPTKDNLNGAREIPIAYFNFFSFWEGGSSYSAKYDGCIDIPADKCKFKLYNISENSDQPSFFAIDYPPFTISKYKVNWDDEWHIAKLWPRYQAYANLEDGNPIYCTNWEGGTLNISLSFGSADFWEGILGISADEVPVCPFVNKKMYAICYSEEWGKKILDLNLDYGLVPDFTVCGDKVEIVFSTERSLDPSPENIYGILTEGNDFNVDLTERYVTWMELVKGGNPLKINAGNSNSIRLIPDWSTTVVEVMKNTIEFTSAQPSKVSIAGNFMPDAFENPEKYELQYKGGDIFEGSFFIDEVDCKDLISTTGLSFYLCAQGPDGSLWNIVAPFGANLVMTQVSLPNDGWIEEPFINSVYNGGGAWSINNWQTGYLNVRVDVGSDLIVISRSLQSGVDAIEEKNDANSDIVEYYNLQGVKVDPTYKGLIIQKRERKAGKVVINR